MATNEPSAKPVLIIGAGISGLLLAQHLRKHAIPSVVFERDNDLTTRGIGWGLTLHWSLPALRSLLPDDLVRRIPDTYVDRAAVEAGAVTRFPFFDLSTGELKAATPKAPESHRIRVTRGRLRQLLATGIDIQWGKAFNGLKLDNDSVTATFDDSSEYIGSLLVGCDGANSRVRRVLFPKPDQHQTYKIPVRILGLKLELSPNQMEPIRQLDPFFLQGTSSTNNSYLYLSLLDSPGNNEQSTDKYSCQLCISWPYRDGFFDSSSPIELPETNAARHQLVQAFAKTWEDPFAALVQMIPKDTDIKPMELSDFPPPKGLRSGSRAVLMGDAYHAMAMYRGEGANHAIVDVLDFADRLTEPLKRPQDFVALRTALDDYEDEVVERARPGVLASRRACLDAHDWQRISPTSPLLSKREMKLQYQED